MNNTWLEQLLGNFPGLAVATAHDGAILYCNKGSHELIAVDNRHSVAKNISELLVCDALTDRVTALHARLTDSVAISETFQPKDQRDLSSPVHISTYQAQAGKHEHVIVTQLSLVHDHKITATPVKSPSAPHESDDERLKQRYQILTAFNDVAVRMMDHQPLNELLQNTADLMLELTSASSSFIHIVKGDDEWLEMIASSGKKVAPLGQRLQKGAGLAGQSWLTGKVEYVENYENFASRVSSIDGVTQACALPMIIRGKVVGVLGIMYTDFREAITEQLELLQQFSTLASIATENSLLLENMRNQSTRDKIMNDLGTVVLKTNSFEELLETTAQTALTVIDDGYFQTWKLDKRGNLSCVAGWVKSDTTTQRQPITEVELGRTAVLQWVSDNPNTNNSAEKPKDYAPLHELVMPSQDNTRHLFIPCLKEDGGGYIFYITIAEGRVFSENTKSLLSAIGNQFSTAAYRQQLQRKVIFHAYHDGLTTLPNRIQFDLSLNNLLSEAKIQKQQFAVLFIDLDGFKAVNDSMGHDTGDKLLVHVAQRFRQVLSKSEVLARIGGDEFGALISLANHPSGIIDTGNRLLASLCDDFTLDNHTPQVGASIGAAIYPFDGTTATQLLRNADTAMYAAKRNGKNRICHFGDLDLDPSRWEREQQFVA